MIVRNLTKQLFNLYLDDGWGIRKVAILPGQTVSLEDDEPLDNLPDELVVEEESDYDPPSPGPNPRDLEGTDKATLAKRGQKGGRR